MGKIREHIGSDTEAVLHWIGRKIKNHQPMTSRDKGGRNPVLCVVHPGNPHELRYGLRDGRQFKITVEEVEADEVITAGDKIIV